MAAPTSNNEVTARRLSRLLVGADGNGGLWGKIKDGLGTKQSLSDCTTFCGATAGWFKVASTDFDLNGANNINAVFEVITRSNSHITYGKLYINVRANSAGNLPGCTDFKYVEESADTYMDSFNLKLKTTGLGANISVELWVNPGTYRAANFSLSKNEDDIHSHKYPWQFFSGEATGSAPVEDESSNIRVFSVNKYRTRSTDWITAGTLPVERGGTGKTTALAANNALLSGMAAATTGAEDASLFVFKYVTPADNIGAVYSRTGSQVWTYFKGKLTSDTGVNISGNAATATTATNYNTSTGTIKSALDGKVGFQLLSDTALIGNGAPAADCKAYWVSANMPDNHITAVYNRPGNEVTLLFSKRGNYGSILKYGYADKYLYMLRFQNSTWKSDDWEKINAGYADSAGTAGTATDYNTSSGTIKTALDSKVSSLTRNGSTITPSGGVAALGYMPVTREGTSSGATVQELIQEIRVKPGGSMGSSSIKASTVGTLSIPAGWYNYIWIPHVRGAATGDEQSYGSLIITLMTNTPDMYVIEGSALAGSSPSYKAKRLAYADHSHGNITDGGTLQTSDISIANGDKLVVTDSSDSAKVARASLAFDGSSYGQLLSKKGTWEYPYEAFLNWGGTNKTGSYGPLDAALVDVLGANRFSFLKPAGITVEYTRDGGTTWTDYGLSDGGKIELFTSTSGNVNPTIGKSDSEHKATADENWANYKLRVTLTAPAIGLYTGIRKIPILVSTSGTAGAKVTARAITRTNEESGGAWTNMGSMSLSGWSGWNILNLSGTYTPWSGSAGQKSQHSKFEMLFEATQATPAASQQYLGLCVIRIFGYGASPAWSKPSVLADTGHLYSFDNAQNATFPARVTATAFNGRLIRELDSSAAINALEIVNVSSGSDGFAIKYARNSSGVNTTTFQSRVSDNDVLSFGNLVGSEYKQAINITNGSATITGSLTGTASTAKAYDTSFTGTNSIKLALDGKQNTLTVMTDTEVSDLLAAMT